MYGAFLALVEARRVLTRMILERCFSRHSSVRRMSHYESKPDTTEEQLRLSHVIKLFKTSIEFPARQQAFVLHYFKSITSSFVFRSGQNRSVSFVIMAQLVKDFEHEEKRKERVIKTRKNTPEERNRQRKEWRKRKQEKQMANSTNKNGELQQSLNREVNDLVLCTSEAEKKKPRPSDREPENVKKPRLLALKPGSGEKKVDSRGYSRASKMIRMAVGADVIVPQKPRERHQTSLIAKKTTASNGSKFEPKELRPENIEFLSKTPVGSGSFGQCFLGRYRGIEVIVKQMTHNETSEDKERARRDLLHEAKVASALGDHPNLPMIFGVVTKASPLCLVTQFHGVQQESVTLHQAADNNVVTKANCISIFKKICSALGHVHSKGYLHNDIKGNNVVLERPSVSEEFRPVLIDFGKSLKASSVTLYRRNGTAMKCKGKSYLAPEVASERLYSVASDIFSLGRMLKAISSMLGFYERVRELVKMSTRDKPSERPSLDVFSRKIAEVKF